MIAHFLSPIIIAFVFLYRFINTINVLLLIYSENIVTVVVVNVIVVFRGTLAISLISSYLLSPHYFSLFILLSLLVYLLLFAVFNYLLRNPMFSLIFRLEFRTSSSITFRRESTFWFIHLYFFNLSIYTLLLLLIYNFFLLWSFLYFTLYFAFCN